MASLNRGINRGLKLGYSQPGTPHTSLRTTLANAWRTYGRILGVIRPHWLPAVGAILSLMLSNGFALVVPVLLAWVVDNGLRSGRTQDLLLAALAVLVASGLRGLFAYWQGNLSQGVSVLVAYDLRNMIYEHLQKLSFSFHDENETGQLMSRMTSDIEGVRTAIPLGFLRVVNTVVLFGGISIILWTLDWQLALITLTCVPVLAVLATNVARKLRPTWTAVQQETGNLSTIMQESLSGHRVVQAFAREQFEEAKFEAKNQDVRNLELAALRLSAWNSPLMILVLNIVTVLVVWVGGAAAIHHALTIGVLVAVVTYAMLLNTPVRSFGFMVTWLMRAASCGMRIFEVLDTQPEIKDKPHALQLTHVQGHVRFENVSFAYSTNGALSSTGGARLSSKSKYSGLSSQVALIGKTGLSRSNGSNGSNGSKVAVSSNGSKVAVSSNGSKVAVSSNGSNGHQPHAPQEAQKVLHDIDIDAKPGQVIALLGATGSGKSTILQLLPRFYDVTSGRVTVDGHDVRDLTQHSLRRNIGFVLQDVFLFNATLRDNLAFGVSNATDEQILAAAKVARAHDFIQNLPDGYDTWVGERGVTLSGGQKQRVAIARTLLLDPRILILDDSTSSVDMETEYLIQEALSAVMKGRTTFVVASRLRTIKGADQILVLDRGRIIERGTHETLLPLGGAYARLYDAQLREQEEFEHQFYATRAPRGLNAKDAKDAVSSQRQECECSDRRTVTEAAD